jgi:hypothetical protein
MASFESSGCGSADPIRKAALHGGASFYPANGSINQELNLWRPRHQKLKWGKSFVELDTGVKRF